MKLDTEMLPCKTSAQDAEEWQSKYHVANLGYIGEAYEAPVHNLRSYWLKRLLGNQGSFSFRHVATVS